MKLTIGRNLFIIFYNMYASKTTCPSFDLVLVFSLYGVATIIF